MLAGDAVGTAGFERTLAARVELGHQRLPTFLLCGHANWLLTWGQTLRV